jgi:hypothetical protein
MEDHGAECKLRFARSALNRYSMALHRPPFYHLRVKTFLDCGRHMVPWLLEAAANSSDCVAICPLGA